jgi:hypothetical protein
LTGEVKILGKIPKILDRDPKILGTLPKILGLDAKTLTKLPKILAKMYWADSDQSLGCSLARAVKLINLPMLFKTKCYYLILFIFLKVTCNDANKSLKGSKNDIESVAKNSSKRKEVIIDKPLKYLSKQAVSSWQLAVAQDVDNQRFWMNFIAI